MKASTGNDIFSHHYFVLVQAFSMMDADRDGFIGENDLRDIHMNLGRQPSEADLKKMLAECPGQLNFTSFLTLFGEKMHGENKARFK